MSEPGITPAPLASSALAQTLHRPPSCRGGAHEASSQPMPPPGCDALAGPSKRKADQMNRLDITYRGTVHQWHCDHMGHMNVMWYVGKFDEATWNFGAMMGLTGEYLKATHRGMAAVEQRIAYRREAL